ncbi:hypothetical protein ACTFIY_005922 [Dictyostelium cf. discoideum]
MEIKKNIFFITGCSGIGFGSLMVQKLLSRGDYVAATSRNKNKLIEDIGLNENDQFLPIEMNLADESNVKEAIEKCIEKFGRIDILISNAAMGILGPLEETTDKDARTLFDINFFGPLNLIRNSLPYLRNNQYLKNNNNNNNSSTKLNGPRIIIIDSICGYSSLFNGCSIYCSSKFALHAISETMSIELKPFNIHCCNIGPGYFQTNFLSSSLIPDNRIAEYKETHSFLDEIVKLNGSRFLGDLSKAVDVIIEISLSHSPPNHVLVGSDAFELFDIKYKKLTNDILIYKEICSNTDKS